MTRIIQKGALTYRAGSFEKSNLFETVKGSDIILPPLEGYEAKVVTRGRGKNKFQTVALKLEFLLTPDVCPTTDNVSWTMPGEESELQEVLLVLGYKPGTLKVYALEESDGKAE